MATKEEIKKKIENKEFLSKEEIEFARSADLGTEPWAKTARKYVLFTKEEYEKKFIDTEYGDSTSTQRSNIWKTLAESSKAEFYYDHLEKYGANASTGDINYENDDGKKIIDAALKQAQSDAGSTIDASLGQSAILVQAALNAATPDPSVQDIIDGNQVRAEVQEEEKKRILDEHLATAKQCYLLNFLENTRQTIAASDVTTWGQRLYFLNSSKPETIFNEVFLPQGHQNVYYSKDSGLPRALAETNFVENSNDISYYDTTNSPFKLLIKKDGIYYSIIDFLTEVYEESLAEMSLSVSFEGGNLTTARNDVSVNFSFPLESFADLTKKMDDGSVSMLDLLLRPEFLAKKGQSFGKYYRRQYSPDDNRIKLVYSAVWKGTNNEKGPKDQELFSYRNSLDLTMIDQSIGIDEDKKLKVDIKYKGYAETFLNMPYMDVIGGRQVLIDRNDRENEIIKAIADNCGEETINFMRESYKNISVQEIQKNKSRIIETLLNNGFIYYIEGQTEQQLKDIFEFGKIRYASNVFEGSIKRVKNSTDEEYLQFINNNDNGYVLDFVYFSDLISSLADLFYDSDLTHDNRNHNSNYNDIFSELNVKFITCPITIKFEGVERQVNIGEIPISIEFLKKFLHDKYISKKIEYASFLSFIRSFTEAAITQMISETCFNDEPWEGSIKTMTIQSTYRDYLQSNDPGSDLDPDTYGTSSTDVDPYGTSNPDTGEDQSEVESTSGGRVDIINVDALPQDNFFTTPKQPTGASIVQTYEDEGLDKIVTYIVIYANVQNYNAKMISDVINELNVEAITQQSLNVTPSEDPASNYHISKTFPIFSDMAKLPSRKDLPHSPGFKFNFSKTDDPNLRAGRYYAYRNDGFVAIGNVYDLSLECDANLGWLFPGHIIISDIYIEEFLDWKSPRAIGNRMGVTGFFIIYKTELTYTPKLQNCKTSFSTKFLDNVLGKVVDPTGQVKKVDAPASSCNKYYTSAGEAYVEGTKVAPTTQLNKVEKQTTNTSTQPQQSGTQQVVTNSPSPKPKSGPQPPPPKAVKKTITLVQSKFNKKTTVNNLEVWTINGVDYLDKNGKTKVSDEYKVITK